MDTSLLICKQTAKQTAKVGCSVRLRISPATFFFILFKFTEPATYQHYNQIDRFTNHNQNVAVFDCCLLLISNPAHDLAQTNFKQKAHATVLWNASLASGQTGQETLVMTSSSRLLHIGGKNQ